MSVEIIHGDCLDVMRGLEQRAFDAVIADPPYGIVDDMGTSRTTKAGGARTLSFDWDGPDVVPGIRFACGVSLTLLKRPGNSFWFCGWDTAEVARDVMRQAGMSVRPYVWTKTCPPPPAPGNRWPSACEFASFGFDAGAYFAHQDPKRCNVVSGDNLRAGNSEKVGHPAQKPLWLMLHLVANLCPPGGRVLDPYGGSGTTPVACFLLGRGCVSIEREAEYVEIARARLAAVQAQGDLFR